MAFWFALVPRSYWFNLFSSHWFALVPRYIGSRLPVPVPLVPVPLLIYEYNFTLVLSLLEVHAVKLSFVYRGFAVFYASLCPPLISLSLNISLTNYIKKPLFYWA